MAISRYGGVTGTAKISEDYENINTAFNNVATESDERQGEVTEHIEDAQIHLSPTDRTKLDSVEPDAEPNQNALAKINDVEASTPTDQFFIVGGLGITVSTNPTTKQITVTATGETAPAAHGTTHNIGGADEIPDLKEAFDNAEKALTKAQLVETLVNDLQTDVNQIDSELTTHTATEVHEGEAHGLRVTDGILEWFNGTEWVAIKGDSAELNTGVTYYVDGVNGNDSNDGLTVATAFKTPQKAINNLPRIINASVGIRIKQGDYSNQSIVVRGFLGRGDILIYGTYTTDASNTRSKISSIHVEKCLVGVTFQSFEPQSPGVPVNVNNSVARFISFTMTIASSYGLIARDRANVTLESSTLSNKTDSAIYADRSLVFSNSNSGSGNVIVLRSEAGSIIAKAGTQPTGTTAEYKNYGGMIT